MSAIPRNTDGSIDTAAFDDPTGVEIYAHGLCHASVCSALPVDEVKAVMAAYPTGISSHWEISENTEFANGQPHPCPCEQKPTTHTHYLFSC